MISRDRTVMKTANDSREWPSPPIRPILRPRDLHVWRAVLDQSQAVVEELREVLAPEELQRARSFHFETDRRHFTVARAVLRKLLSAYLEIDHRQIALSHNEYGKPAVAEPINNLGLRFNVAHSGGLALYAIALNRRVGVDVESVRPAFTGDEIARRYFSPNEIADLDKLPANLRHKAFFDCWTRKEAFIKAIGVGLSLPLDQFDVTVDPDEQPALLHTRWNESEASRWSLMTLDAGPGYAAAVVGEGHNWNLCTWRLDL
jgi:4'-phosphopantetheinyl transferase